MCTAENEQRKSHYMLHTCFNNKKCKNDGGPKTAMIFACFRTVHPTIYGSEKKSPLNLRPGAQQKKTTGGREKIQSHFLPSLQGHFTRKEGCLGWMPKEKEEEIPLVKLCPKDATFQGGFPGPPEEWHTWAPRKCHFMAKHESALRLCPDRSF